MNALTAEQRALAKLEAMMDEREAGPYRLRFQIRNRTRRRELVNHYAEHRDELLGFLSRHPAPTRFESLAEAIVWFRKEMASQRAKRAHGHWAFSNGVLAACKDRLIVARYFALLAKAEAAERMREAA